MTRSLDKLEEIVAKRFGPAFTKWWLEEAPVPSLPLRYRWAAMLTAGYAFEKGMHTHEKLRVERDNDREGQPDPA